MLDDFFVRALLAGVGIALIAGPLGCFIVWRRMAYYGDTLAHAALLGVALAFLLETHLVATVFVVSVAISLALLALQRRGTLSSDALLGLLSHSALALGLVALAFMTWVRIDLMGFLFGDILAASRADLLAIWLGGPAILAGLALVWRPLLAGTVSRELSAAEGLSPQGANVFFMVLLAGVIAVAMKMIGVLLVTALLIIPAATARRFAPTPEAMAVLAAVAGVLGVVAGLYGSLALDTPSGPSIVVACLALFVASLAPAPARLAAALRGRKEAG